MSVRGFKIVTKYQNEDITLPQRSTTNAAGYDFSASADIIVGPENPVLVPTGIKAYMPANEYLMLVNRSSGPIKRNLTMPNGVGIVDADYYNNQTNEGELFFQMLSLDGEVQIKKGDRIGQGIFMPFLLADDDQADGTRTGGFGSTGDK